jgi:hypothetical protein
VPQQPDDIERRLLDAEDEAAKAVLAVWEQTRLELLGRLVELGGPDAPMTFAHRKSMLVQVEKQIKALESRLSDALLPRVAGNARFGAKTAATETGNALGDQGIVAGLSRLNPEAVEWVTLKAGEKIKGVTQSVLTGIRTEIAVGIGQGLHPKQVIKQITATGLTLDGIRKGVFKSVEDRAEAMARTEMGDAFNDGHLKTIEKAQADGRPVGKGWMANLDNVTSRRCRSLHRKYNGPEAGIPVDENFVADDGWRGMRPCSHPRCRCRLVVRKLKAIVAKAVQALSQPKDARRETIRRFVERDQWQPEEAIQVATLPDDLREAIGAKTDVVQLSGATMTKQKAHHAELPTVVYTSIPSLVSGADLIAKDGDRTLVVMQKAETLIYAALKATQSGEGVFLTSIRFAQKADIARARKRWQIIRDGLK